MALGQGHWIGLPSETTCTPQRDELLHPCRSQIKGKGRSGISVSTAVTVFVTHTHKKLPTSAQKTWKYASAWGHKRNHLLFWDTECRRRILQEISDGHVVIWEKSLGRVYFTVHESMHESLKTCDFPPSAVHQPGIYDECWVLPSVAEAALHRGFSQMAQWRAAQWNRRWTAEVFLRGSAEEPVSWTSLHSAFFQLVY